MNRGRLCFLMFLFLLIFSNSNTVFAKISPGKENSSTSWQSNVKKLKFEDGASAADLVELANSFMDTSPKFIYSWGGKTLSKSGGGIDCAAFCCRMVAGLTKDDKAPYGTTSTFRKGEEDVFNTREGDVILNVYKCVKYKGDGLTEKDVKPGQILVSGGHAVIYTGNGHTAEAMGRNYGLTAGKLTPGKYKLAFEVIGLKYDGSSKTNGTGNTGSKGEWCTVTINQGGVGHSSGCTVCTLQLILQNSTQLKDNQLKGAITSATDDYKKFDEACKTAGFIDKKSTDSWIIGSFASGASKLSKSGWNNEGKTKFGGDSAMGEGYNSTTAIVGLGDKKFSEMTPSEQATAMKVFWNAGYFVVFCVEYKGVEQDSNGPDGYKAAHATMLAGVKGKKIYINDPATGKIEDYGTREAKGGKYNLMYIELFKNDETSPRKISGKEAGNGDKNETDEDDENLKNMGLSSVALDGYWSEENLSSYTKLHEVDISDMFLNDATRDSLNQEDLTSLSNWERNVNDDLEKVGLIRFLRIVTILFGILITIWSILIYVAYWFDRLNNVFDLNIVGILTLGKLRACEDENESTFSARALGSHTETTINHRNAIFISVLGIIFGVLVISGVLYKFILGIVNFVLTMLEG